MATEHDTRPREPRAQGTPTESYGAEGATGAPYKAGTPGSHATATSRSQPGTTSGMGGANRNYYIIGGLIVAGLVLLLIFGAFTGGSSSDQTAPVGTTAPATEQSAPAGSGTGSGAEPGTGSGGTTATD